MISPFETFIVAQAQVAVLQAVEAAADARRRSEAAKTEADAFRNSDVIDVEARVIPDVLRLPE